MRRLAEQVRSRLSDLPPADIEDYANHWWRCMDLAYRWPVWDAAIVWLGWFGDDSFRDFRGLLSSRGRTVFEKVLAAPDSLADDPDDRESPFAEVWDGLVHDVYEVKSGHLLPGPAPKGLTDPAGVRIDVN